MISNNQCTSSRISVNPISHHLYICPPHFFRYDNRRYILLQTGMNDESSPCSTIAVKKRMYSFKKTGTPLGHASFSQIKLNFIVAT